MYAYYISQAINYLKQIGYQATTTKRTQIEKHEA